MDFLLRFENITLLFTAKRFKNFRTFYVVKLKIVKKKELTLQNNSCGEVLIVYIRLYVLLRKSIQIPMPDEQTYLYIKRPFPRYYFK